MIDLQQLQREHAEWSHRNFGPDVPWRGQAGITGILGVIEEVGELAHGILKRADGIRTNEPFSAAERDAVGDIVIFLVSLCNARGHDLEDVITDVWSEVKLRDWQKFPDAAHVMAEAARASDAAGR